MAKFHGEGKHFVIPSESCYLHEWRIARLIMHCFNTRQPKVCRHASHQCYNRVNENKGIEGRGSRERGNNAMVGCKTGNVSWCCIYNLEFTIVITALFSTIRPREWRPIPGGHSHLLTRHRFKLTSTVYVSILSFHESRLNV